MEDGKKKSLASLIVSKSPPPAGATSSSVGEGKPAMEEESEEGMSDIEVAGQEVMDAVSSGDVASFTDSLKSFIKLCSYEDDGE